MKDFEDIVAYKKSIELLWVHIFLNGLDAEFKQIQGEILRKDPALILEETYVNVHRDYIHRAAFNGKSKHSESYVIVAR
jgi:hypothetical protein